MAEIRSLKLALLADTKDFIQGLDKADKETKTFSNKLDKAKEGIVLPLFCPKCSKATKQHLDKKWFIMYGHCFNCQVDHEHNLRKEGKLEEVEKQVINQHLEGTIKDFEVWFDELINEKRGVY